MTVRKWIWSFIDTVSVLEADLVSVTLQSPLTLHPLPAFWLAHRSFGERVSKVTDWQIASSAMIELISACQSWARLFWSQVQQEVWFAMHDLCLHCVQCCNIVWIHGPFPCGRWPDICIFSRLALAQRVEIDDGHIGGAPATTHKLPQALH